jgi:hypothetical protein
LSAIVKSNSAGLTKKPLTLEEEFGPSKTEEVPWERVRSPLVQFIADAGDGGVPGFLHARLEMAFLDPFRERLTLAWAGGTVVIAGPKASEFYAEFARNEATLVRKGPGIESVEFRLKEPAEGPDLD